jgi:hypothetical protein
VRRVEVHCPSCGSADTVRLRLRESDDEAAHAEAEKMDVAAEQWSCYRCDHSFSPRECPYCGSFRVTGARGVSGAPFVDIQAIVSCSDCKEEFVAHPSVLE